MKLVRTIVSHEDAFIDLAFQQGPIEGLTPKEIKRLYKMDWKQKINPTWFRTNL